MRSIQAPTVSQAGERMATTDFSATSMTTGCKSLVVMIVTVVMMLAVVAANASAAAPGWKALAVAGPTHMSKSTSEQQTVSIWAGTNGYLDEVPVEDILRFESEFLDYLANNSEALNTLRSTNVLDDDTVAELQSKIESFKLEFRTSSGQALNEQFEELAEEEIKQEQLVVTKK